MPTRKSKPALEGEKHARTHSERKSETVEETTPEQTAEEGWSKDDIASISPPAAKVEDTEPKGTYDLTVIAEGREFPDVDGNMIATGEKGTFDAGYGAMLKKLKVAK